VITAVAILQVKYSILAEQECNILVGFPKKLLCELAKLVTRSWGLQTMALRRGIQNEAAKELLLQDQELFPGKS
jgi:hypothetical protein